MPAVKNVGEPCAGEPHARFEVAAGGIWRSVGDAARALAPPADPPELGRGVITAAISDAMVGSLSRHTGRRATSAWTTLGDDLVVCVLGDALTKGEKNLVKHGNREAGLDLRKAYQDSMAAEAIGVVEELTGRRVTAVMSNNHIDPDLAVEIFVLLTPPGDRDSKSDGRAATLSAR